MTDSEEKPVKLSGFWAFLVLASTTLSGLASFVNWFIMFTLFLSFLFVRDWGKLQGVALIALGVCCFIWAFDAIVEKALMKKLDKDEAKA